jgi:hypothetical protein
MVPPILAAILIAGGMTILGRVSSGSTTPFLILLSLALLGVVSGVVTGQSRAPSVGAVVPAILSLASALMVYIVSAKEPNHQRAASGALTAFALTFFIGIHFGSAARHLREDFLTSEDYLLRQAAIDQNIKLQQLLYDSQIIEAKELLDGLKPNVPIE